MKNLFIAATEQHIGKTTSTLGILSYLKNCGYQIGYCKPVGQQFVSVDGLIADKDAVLFSKVIGFDINPDLHSPVILGKGATSAYLENPSDYQYEDRILEASKKLQASCDIVVYEGTGHPGVGSVVELSNADVAKLLNAGVVMIVEGGVGNTIDRLNLGLALFREKSVPILGVIVNKVIPEKKDKIAYLLKKKLDQMGIPLLGLLPYDQTLSFPIMASIRRAVKGKVILNENKMANPVVDYIAGSLVDMEEFSSFENVLLVVSDNRLNEAIDKIVQISQSMNLEKSPLSGVIVTGDGRHDTTYTPSDLAKPYFVENQIPVVTTSLDTYGSVVKISRMEVKINARTPWKINRAVNLIKKHVNFDLLLNQLELQPKEQS